MIIEIMMLNRPNKPKIIEWEDIIKEIAHKEDNYHLVETYTITH